VDGKPGKELRVCVGRALRTGWAGLAVEQGPRFGVGGWGHGTFTSCVSVLVDPAQI
jgi:hypothetical protein